MRQLAEVGIGEVTLIGGETFLRRDFLTIARALTDAGMLCTITTGGYGITARMAQDMVVAGIRQVSVSVDGMETAHDQLRNRRGSWQACFDSMRYLRGAGMPLACNTQINRLTAPDMPLLYQRLREAGVRAWQLQLTAPMGHAANHVEIVLQPAELLDVFPMLASLKQQAEQDQILLLPSDNVGYFGPYDRLLRGDGDVWNVWTGCHAGLSVLGLEADGTVKPCSSLPAQAFAAGNVRQHRLGDLLAESPRLSLNAGASTEHMWGFCGQCQYAALCRGGCTWTSYTIFERRGNNPLCHHRAITLRSRGLRERLVLRRTAGPDPFDTGAFDLIEEPVDAPWPANDPLHFEAAAIRWVEEPLLEVERDVDGRTHVEAAAVVVGPASRPAVAPDGSPFSNPPPRDDG